MHQGLGVNRAALLTGDICVKILSQSESTPKRSNHGISLRLLKVTNYLIVIQLNTGVKPRK